MIKKLFNFIKHFGKNKRNVYKDIFNGYDNIIAKLQTKDKIRVCFSVVFDSVFPAEPVFRKMLDDPLFEPFILVIPDSLRGTENMFCQMNKTFKTLSSKYKNVYMSYDAEKQEFTDWHDKMDMCFFANPYDSMTNSLYQIRTLAEHNKLTMYTHYGYQISNVNDCLFKSGGFDLLWKVFLLNKYEQRLLKKNANHGKNGVLVGYTKMDAIAKIKPTKRTRKKIIIAPHHTVMEWKNGLELSNFLRYYKFFIELFKKYPDIDFVFRPHPLLWINLANNKIWTQKQIDKYIKDITSLPNVEFQNGGEYLETFVNSDALIHDCGSFSAEYLFVNKPCCYLLKSKEMLEQNSNDFHKQCIDLHYSAYNEQDIIDFIERRVILNDDDKSAARQKFVCEELTLEYPNVTTKIYEYIKQKIKQKNSK